MTAFGLPSPQQRQQETVKSPIVVPSVKSPTPEPAELETRRVSASLCCLALVLSGDMSPRITLDVVFL